MLSQYCKQCLLKRQQERVRDLDHERKESYLNEIEACIASATQEDTAPVISNKINLLHEQYFGVKYSFDEEKKKYNRIMLQKEQEINHKIEQAEEF